MGLFDVLAGLAGGGGAGYLESVKASQQAQDDAEKIRQREAQTIKDRLAAAQAEMALKQEGENLQKLVASNAGQAATKTMVPAGPSEQPLAAGTDQTGPVAPPTKTDYQVPEASLSALPADRREAAKAAAINQRTVSDANQELAQSYKGLQGENLKSQIGHRSAQDETTRQRLELQGKALEDRIASRTRPKMYAPRLITDENGNQFFVDPVEALNSGASWSKQLPAAMLDEKAQALGSKEWGQRLLSELPKIANKLGPLMGRENSMQLLLGSADPEVAGFARDLASLAALQPKIHGMRGQRAMEDFQRGITLEQNPAAIGAAIQSYINLADTIAGAKEHAARPGGTTHGAAPGQPKATHRFNPATGQLEPIS